MALALWLGLVILVLMVLFPLCRRDPSIWSGRRICQKTTTHNAPPPPLKIEIELGIDLKPQEPLEGCMNFCFGNPTVWGPTAHRFTQCSKASLWGIAESHLSKDNLRQVERKAVKGRFALDLLQPHWGRRKRSSINIEAIMVVLSFCHKTLWLHIPWGVMPAPMVERHILALVISGLPLSPR